MVDLTQVAFWIISFYIIVTMIQALRVEKVMQSAYWLILMLVGVALMFLLANSEIIFAFQVSIYAGGIAVLLLFAVLLTEEKGEYIFPSSISGFARATWSQVVIFLILTLTTISLIFESINDEGYSEGLQELADTGIRVYPDPLNLDYSDPDFDFTEVPATATDIGAFEITRNYTIYLWDVFGQVIPFLAALLLAALLGSIKLVIREWEIEENLPEDVKAKLQEFGSEASS